MGYDLGVDLGGTTVAAAGRLDAQAEMLPLGAGTMTIPALVFLDDDGTLVAGENAARRAFERPHRVGRELRRRLGSTTPVRLGHQSYPPATLLGALLQDVVVRLAEGRGGQPDRIVLTHPAHWSTLRRAAFAESGRAAGLPEFALLTEPEAVAAHYAASGRLAVGDTVAVYDLGGGTFDATVLCRTESAVEVLGQPEGIERLGGGTFDEAILTHVNQVTDGPLSGLDRRDPQHAAAVARLRQHCVLAKETLSVETSSRIPVLLPNRQAEVVLTRAEFEQMIRISIEATVGTLLKTLDTAGVQPAELATVLLVGGSARIPLVAEMITGALARPIVLDAQPEYPVALGAATVAGAGRRAAPARVPVPAPRTPERAPAAVGAGVAPGRSAGAAPGPTTRTGPRPTPAPAASTRPASSTGPGEPAEQQTAPTDPTEIESAMSTLAAAETTRNEPTGIPSTRNGAAEVETAATARTSVETTRIDGPAEQAVASAAPVPADTTGTEPAGVDPTEHTTAPTPAAADATRFTPARDHPNEQATAATAPASADTTRIEPAGFGTGPIGLRFGDGPNDLGAARTDRGPAALFEPNTPVNPTFAAATAGTADPATDAALSTGPGPAVSAAADTESRPGVILIDAPAAAPTTPAQPAPIQPVPGSRAGDHPFDGVSSPAGAGPASPYNRVIYPPAPGPTGAVRPRHRSLLALTAVGLVALLVGAGYLIWNRMPGPTAAGPAPAAPAPVAGSVAEPQVVATVPVGDTPGFVAVSPDGRRAIVANQAAGVITVLDTATNAVTARIPVPAGPPQYLAFSPSGERVYISVWNQARTVAAVAVVDTATNAIVATVPVRTRPYLAAVTPDGQRLYVPNHDSGTISVIDTGTNTVTTEIKVAPNPHWIEMSRDGTRAYAANHESNLVSVIDTTSNTILAEVPVQTSPHSLAEHPTRPLVANVNYDAASATMIDTDTDRVVAAVPVGKNPQAITWAPDGRHAYVVNTTDGTVSVIDADTDAVTATVRTGASPTSVAVRPDGSAAYVSNLGDGTLSVLAIAG